MQLVPRRFFADSTNGRWYVFGCCRRKNRCSVLPPLRLDALEFVRPGKPCGKACPERVSETLARLPDTSWIVSGSLRGTKEVKVVVETAGLTPFLLSLLDKLRQRATAVSEQGTECFLTFHVADPREMLPHLRMFGPSLTVLPGPDHRLDEELQSSWQEVLANYDIV